jgi:4a-hydroxytetrahydrobiopterin dehydratase
MARLSDVQVAEALAQLPGWGRRGDRIEKEFVFATFPDLVAFLVRLAFEAEAADHHPDAAIHYRRLTLTYWTHSEGGITAKDVQGATMAERLMAERGTGR